MKHKSKNSGKITLQAKLLAYLNFQKKNDGETCAHKTRTERSGNCKTTQRLHLKPSLLTLVHGQLDLLHPCSKKRPSTLRKRFLAFSNLPLNNIKTKKVTP